MSYIPQVSCSRCSRPPDPQSVYGTLCQIGRSNFQAVSGILFCVVLLLILWHPHVCASYPFTSLELRSSAPRPPIPHSAYRRNPFLPRAEFNPLLQKESFSLMAISPFDKNPRSKNPLMFSSPPSPSYPFCQQPLSTKTPSVLRGVHCACLRMHPAGYILDHCTIIRSGCGCNTSRPRLTKCVMFLTCICVPCCPYMPI
jgi:hypothetical protein